MTGLQELLVQGVSIPVQAEVRQYLAQYPDLSEVLPRICAAIRGDLGPAFELSLELYKDPEIDDCYLTLYVRKGTYDAPMADQINAIASQFDDQLSNVAGYLLITTDFRPPRGANGL